MQDEMQGPASQDGREEGVQHTLPGEQRRVGDQLLCHGPGGAHRPSLQHGVLLHRRVPVFESSQALVGRARLWGCNRKGWCQKGYLFDAAKLQLQDLVLQGVVAGRRNPGDVAPRIRLHHDPMVEQRVLLDLCVDVTSCEPVPNLQDTP